MKINPIVYDKLETDFNHYGLAVLENSDQLRVLKRRNAEYLCSFTLPLTDEKAAYCLEENIVKVNGQLFVIRVRRERMAEDGSMLLYIEAEHIFSELLGRFIETLELSAVSAQAALDALLFGTRFSGSALSVVGAYDFTLEKKSAVAGIDQLIDLTKGEIERDNFTVNLKPEIGADNGVSFRYRHNMRGITRTIDTKNVITRLYVYGKDGLTIAGINDGLPYLDSPNINLYPAPKATSVTFSEVTDPVELKSKGESLLATIDTAMTSYDCLIVELKRAAGYENEFVSFDLGDTVGAYNEDMGINVKTRVVEYEEWLNEPDKSRAVLADYRPDQQDLDTKLVEARQIVQQTTYKGRLNTYWLDGIIDALKNQVRASGSFVNAQVLEDQGFLLENNDIDSPDYGALYLGPGWFMIANSKLGDGSWNWRTFGNGAGFTADEINTGILNASLVKILSQNGFLEIFGDQLTVYDDSTPTPKVRVRLGQYAAGKYGLQLKNKAGTSTVLDEDGMLQSYSLQLVDNVDSGFPITFKFFIPTETISIRKVLLNFSREAFRAYNTGAASGGGVVVSAESTTTTSGSEDYDGSVSYVTGLVQGSLITDYAGGHGHSLSIASTGANAGEHFHFLTNSTTQGAHNHGFDNGASYQKSGGGSSAWVDFTAGVSVPTRSDTDGEHSHIGSSADSVGDHFHEVFDHRHFQTLIPHDHDVVIPSHSHSIPNHTHAMVYGIYTSTLPTNISININGNDRTADLSGPFNTDQSNLEITAFVTQGWNTVQLGSTQLGRINASMFIQIFQST